MNINTNINRKTPTQVRIHWSGCPNTCGQVQIGTIGLLGTQAKNAEGKMCEAVDVYIGGGIGQDGAVGSMYTTLNQSPHPEPIPTP